MEVLVKNTHAGPVPLAELAASFWDPDCFYPGPVFSYADSLTREFRYSPFYVLQPPVAFLLAQIGPGSTLVRGTGALGAVLALDRSGGGRFAGDPVRFDRYAAEYLPASPLSSSGPWRQVVTYGETGIDPAFWDQLSVGGIYLLGTHREPELPPGLEGEPRRGEWRFGAATQNGWRIHEPELGFEDFILSAFRKTGER
jgi:hypothetical protein